jgi:hypothetical protein
LALKKKQFADGEIAIFDEACIYKRGEYWQFRMWLPKENRYARKSLRTRSEATAIERGKAAYLEIYANLQQGKSYFSITTKEGVEKYLSFRKRDVELGHIVKGRHTTIATHLQHFLSFIGKDTKLKELERSDCENYFYHRHKSTNTKVKQVTVQNEQSTINALMKWLHKNGETHIDGFDTLDAKCESLCEDALEILHEIVTADPSLQLWFDRELDFSHGSLIDANLSSLPRLVTSRSNEKQRGDIRAMSKREVKLSVVERALQAIGRDEKTAPIDAKAKLRDFLQMLE